MPWLGGGRPRCLFARGVPPAHEDAAAERGPLGEAVDPPYRVRPVFGSRAQTVEHGGEARNGLGLDDHPRALDGPETQRHLGDEPGQAHAAHGGEEELTLAARATLHEPSVRDLHDESLHEAAEGSVAMMVLAVHVARDG